ncbi:MAG: hypothetical protein ACOVOX_09120 [Burkholderiaceae bacterium]
MQRVDTTAPISWMFVLCVMVLCLFKAIGVLQDGERPWQEHLPTALHAAAMLGSPQLLWALVCSKSNFSRSQAFVATLTVIAFITTAVLFGSFPGAGRPDWGGEGLFEVPIAFVVEWLIAGVLLLVFWVAGYWK